MRGSGRLAAWAAGGALALFTWSNNAGAQTGNGERWRYSFTPYGWLTGLEGDVGVGPVSSSVDLNPSDILSSLKFALMGTAEAHKGAWMVSADGAYASLGTNRALAIRGATGELSMEQRETIIQPTGGYTLDFGRWSVDFLAGMRYWNLSTTIDLDRSTQSSDERSDSRQWLDATGGFRFRWTPYEKVNFVAAADAGGGGSRGTWQAYSSLGYDFWQKWSLGIAYRALAVNYDRDDFLFDTRTKGFAIGGTYRTW
jgi:hypothetical protein